MAPLILHVFPTFAVGGAQMRFAAVANHWGKRFRHAVVAMDGNTACSDRLDPALDVQFPAVGVRKGDTLGNVRRFRRVLRDMRPHALLTSNFGSIEWAIANFVPVVRHVHIEDGFGPDEAGGQIRRRVLMRRALLRGRRVVLPSQTLVGIARDVWRLDPRWLQHLPNGVDLRRFAPGQEVRAVPVVGTVAALRPEKNLGRLLRAFAAASDVAHLVVVGDGPERGTLEGLARELGMAGRVRFTGAMADTAAAYRGFDVFALPSDTEQMPLSLLEAMASGLPVAATDVGDVRAMLDRSNGPYVVAKEDTALAGALRALLEQAGVRAAVGRANRVVAEQRFGQGAMFEAWAAVMDEP